MKKKLSDEIVNATDELRWTMRNTEARRDPWIPQSMASSFSDYAMALIELMGNDRANAAMSDAVITELGPIKHATLRQDWIKCETSWIDMCAQALRDAGKETP